MACDTALLEAFLQQLDRRADASFEFRHPSWFNGEVYALLRAHRAALVIAESATLRTPIVPTAPHGYLRLRMETYDDPALERWAAILHDLAAGMEAIYVFFKHEAAAPGFAMRLARMTAREG
jgi:uncharacterized protein YecE (DUF72 family)